MKRFKPLTLIDLRVEYKRNSGNSNTPLSHGHFSDVDYIVWLEDQLLKHKDLKRRLIPWESLNKTGLVTNED